MAGPTAFGPPTKRNCSYSIPNSAVTAGTSDRQLSPECVERQATIMATAPPTCAPRNILEWKTRLFVRKGGSCQPRYVQSARGKGPGLRCRRFWPRGILPNQLMQPCGTRLTIFFCACGRLCYRKGRSETIKILRFKIAPALWRADVSCAAPNY